MPVVINEFEVVPEAPAPRPANASPEGESREGGPSEEKPDFEDLLRTLHQRRERVRAH